MDLHLFLTNRTGNEMLAQRENEKDRERGKEKEKTQKTFLLLIKALTMKVLAAAQSPINDYFVQRRKLLKVEYPNGLTTFNLDKVHINNM